MATAARQRDQRADGRRARGDRTRRTILDHAVQIASTEGLEGLSIGRLADELGVSKSGLFAHFGSKQELQVATVRAARELFLDEVVASARVGGGIDEIHSLTDSWLGYMEREVFAAAVSSPLHRWSSTAGRDRSAMRSRAWSASG